MGVGLRNEWLHLRGKETWPLLCIVAINGMLWFCTYLAPQFKDLFGLPGRWDEYLSAPWTLLTYMFIQEYPWHLLGNMLVLWCFGCVLLISARGGYIWCLYLAGGLFGGLAYLLAGCLGMPGMEPPLIGASAAVFAVVCATALRAPDFQVRLLLIGGIRVRWIALVVILLSMIYFFKDNLGSGVAHIGGMVPGLAWGFAIRRGHDLFGFIMRPKGRRKTVKRDARRFKKKVSAARNADSELDSLLDKVRVSGYESLSQKEKERLKSLSQQI